MALFRPYKHEPARPDGDTDDVAGSGDRAPSSTPRLDASRARLTPTRPTTPPATPPATGDTAVDDPEAASSSPSTRVRTPKDRPTPTRREAEAARRERLNPSLSKKDARRRSAEANRRTRMEQMAARDSTPAKVLLRDHIDARFSLGQMLLPALLLIVMTTFAQTFFPQAVLYSTVAMYVFLGLVVLDFLRMWRGFRKLAAERGVALERGLKMYGVNRTIQIRRMRLPKPRVARGDTY